MLNISFPQPRAGKRAAAAGTTKDGDEIYSLKDNTMSKEDVAKLPQGKEPNTTPTVVKKQNVN